MRDYLNLHMNLNMNFSEESEVEIFQGGQVQVHV